MLACTLASGCPFCPCRGSPRITGHRKVDVLKILDEKREGIKTVSGFRSREGNIFKVGLNLLYGPLIVCKCV